MIFTDTSNDSILDVVSLHDGRATFETSALAVGTRSLVASYGGNNTTAGSTSLPVGVTVTPGTSSESVAFQVDAEHDGDQTQEPLNAAHLVRKWTSSLGLTGAQYGGPSQVSYAVIARGRVFVTVKDVNVAGDTELDALNANTGAVDWSINMGPNGYPSLAYDGRHLFVMNDPVDVNGTAVSSLVAATGKLVWTDDLPMYNTADPTAYDGVLYVGAAGQVTGLLTAISEANGAIDWTEPVHYGDDSSPAVNNTGVYVSYEGEQDYRFGLAGQLEWHFSGDGVGGGGSTPALYANAFYAPIFLSRTHAGQILSETTGKTVGAFTSAAIPAFDSKNMYVINQGDLQAESWLGGSPRWTYNNGELVTPPVVSGGVVYAGNSDGTVYGASATSGAEVWSGVANFSTGSPGSIMSLALGDGLLVVPFGYQLTAFGG